MSEVEVKPAEEVEASPQEAPPSEEKAEESKQGDKEGYREEEKESDEADQKEPVCDMFMLDYALYLLYTYIEKERLCDFLNLIVFGLLFVTYMYIYFWMQRLNHILYSVINHLSW